MSIERSVSGGTKEKVTKKFSIAAIPGDGIGSEVVPATIEVLQDLGEKCNIEFSFTHYDWGSEYYFKNHRMMPIDGLTLLKTADAILLGAVGHPSLPDNITATGLMYPLRGGFDLFANVRPAVLYPGVECPLRGDRAIDMVIVRENTEGEYAQAGGLAHQGHGSEVAVQVAVFTRQGTERVIRFAFDLAARRRKRLTLITKTNALGFGFGLWDRIFKHVSSEYPNIETESLLVDAAAMQFVRRPETFDVVVASNLFGDILSDLAAAVTGSIGLAPSANIDPTRRFPSMFEPVHGSAPDIAGRGIANPLGTILSAAMMLDHLGLRHPARMVETAVRWVLEEGRVRTADIGGKSTMREVIAEIREKIQTLDAVAAE